MHTTKRAAVVAALSGLLVAGTVTGFALAASANVAGTCDASNNAGSISCQLTDEQVGLPSAVSLVVTLKSGDGKNDQYIGVSWHGFCYENGSQDSASITPSPNPPPKTPISTAAPVTFNLKLPYPNSRSCDISAIATLYASLGGSVYGSFTTGSIHLELQYTPAVTATPSPSASSPPAVPLIKGYGGKCLSDKGNSSANRTAVIIWTCNSADPAQGWKFTGGELVHNGKCADDKANGGSGTKVILWTCNHTPDETWTHTGSDGEFVLTSRSHGRLCLDDPGNSTTNRTQLIVYNCHNTSNQHWT